MSSWFLLVNCSGFKIFFFSWIKAYLSVAEKLWNFWAAFEYVCLFTENYWSLGENIWKVIGECYTLYSDLKMSPKSIIAPKSFHLNRQENCNIIVIRGTSSKFKNFYKFLFIPRTFDKKCNNISWHSPFNANSLCF